jgi:dipeptidyl aminopeptidase/acylaminoacyl peptidase
VLDQLICETVLRANAQQRKNKTMIQGRTALVSLFSVLCLLAACRAGLAAGNPTKRPVTVADAIEMTKVGDLDLYWGSPNSEQLAHFSPDGRKVIVLARRGNLHSNTRDYSLLLWRTNELLTSSPPTVLVTMSSSSNRPAIKDPIWLSDSETVAFLGEHPSELRQVYLCDTQTKQLRQITHHSTNVLSFSVSRSGAEVAYVAEQPLRSMWNKRNQREGISVSYQPLSSLVRGEEGGARGNYNDADELFLQARNRTRRQLYPLSRIDGLNPAVFLSSDGQSLLVPTLVRSIPDIWKEYSDPEMQRITRQELRPNQYSELKQCELITTSTGGSRILVAAPLGPGGLSVAWSPSGHSVVLRSSYLPLENTSGEERRAKRSTTFAVEVQLPDRNISQITNENLLLLNWDPRTNLVHFLDLTLAHENPLKADLFFRRNAETWTRVPPPESEQVRAKIFVEEDSNNAPKIYTFDPTMNKNKVLFDPNPQFAELSFARVEEISWKGSDGHDVKGGLYYPLHFVPGKKYPLVIQTHGWLPEAFWIDGPMTTAFAAQPLAGKDIMVLQADEGLADMGTPNEMTREVSTIEGAIDYLNEKGFIDRERVGVIGFSRTCLFVTYALGHSRYHFAAASVTDGVDAGYFQYMLTLNAYPGIPQDFEGINGGMPFGEGLKAWMIRSPSFSAENVRTPLRITALSPPSILFEWEWFAALLRLGKPVDMVAIKNGDHILQKPWDRMISQQGNVDWFCFWLKGEEDPDPRKHEQYARWRTLRNQAALAQHADEIRY